MKKKIGCLVDGEHYIPNIKDTLDKVSKEYDIEVAIFIGGTEKIGDKNEVKETLGYHVEFAEHDAMPDPKRVGEIARNHDLDFVMDYSDEPIVNYDIRMHIACELLAAGVTYRGADFEFTPMEFKDILTKPSIAIWGTAKRVGKTAIGGYVARTLQEAGFAPGVVTLSRGGPNKPEVIRGDMIEMKPEFFLTMQDKGFHAASDNFEDALTGGAVTFGCKRCGGGFAGKPNETIVDEGAVMADMHPDVKTVVLEGSGATFPEIKTDRVILLVGAGQPINHITGYFGPFRIKFANLVIVAMCEEPMADEEKVREVYDGVKSVNPDAKVVLTIFRPKPIGDIKGKKVLFATTAPEAVMQKLVSFLEEEFDCEIVGSTHYLSNQAKLRKDIAKYIGNADVILTELKAAAVKVVTKEAVDAGIDVVYCDNIPIVIGGDFDNLKDAVLDLMNGI